MLQLMHCYLTLYQPMTHICVMSSHKPIIIYMGGLILGVNTLHRLFCFFKLFPMVGKGLRVCNTGTVDQLVTWVHPCLQFCSSVVEKIPACSWLGASNSDYTALIAVINFF